MNRVGLEEFMKTSPSYWNTIKRRLNFFILIATHLSIRGIQGRKTSEGLEACGQEGRERKQDEIMSESSGEIFHESVIFEIVQRLSLKYIFRFKCVSKAWNSMISDPFFAQTYVDRKSDSYLPTWIFLYHYYNENDLDIPPSLHVASHDALSSELTLNFLNPDIGPKSRIKVLAVSNGWLLCTPASMLNSTHQHHQYYVCNPLTRQCVSLPPSPRTEREGNWYTSIGFMVDPDSGAFQVMRLPPPIVPGGYSLDVYIFSSHSYEWKERKLSCPVPIHNGAVDKVAMPCKGVLHWLTPPRTIMAYDPKNNEDDKFRRIALPVEFPAFPVLGLSRGNLCYFEVADRRPMLQSCNLSIWTMKDYDKGEWSLECRINIANVWSSAPYVRFNFKSSKHPAIPLAFHPLDPKIVYLAWDGRLLTFNIFSRSLEPVCNIHPKGQIYSSTFFPFMLPPWPTQIHRPLSKLD